MKRKVAYITGSRADFGLMVPILHKIEESNDLSLQVYATSVHLMKEFGYTFNQVKKEFPSALAIEGIFESDEREAMAKFLGPFVTKFVDNLESNRPDIAFIPCDRIEAFAAMVACYYLGLPICHIHGGEKTFTVDESARHAMTKLAHVHFAATEDAAARIERLGEERWRIHIVGAPMLDMILNEKLPDRKTLFKELGMPLETEKFLLVTQHAVSEEYEKAGQQIEETIKAVKSFNLPAVFVYPPADAGGKRVIQAIEKHRGNPFFYIFPHIPQRQFLALERESSVWIGNSSAGIIESASFKIPVVNVGIRQTGRERSGNVIDVRCDAEEIKRAIEKSLYDEEYRKKISKISNVWGDGKASERVVKVLESLEIGPKLLTKQITY